VECRSRVPPNRRRGPRRRLPSVGVSLAPFRWPLALLAGAGCELVSSLWVSGDPGFGLLIAGYVLLMGFAAANLAVTGSVLVLVGLAANLTVMALDGGMPVRGLSPDSGFGPRHHAQRRGDHLTGLGDVVALPALGEVVSPGDLVLVAGVTTMVVTLAGPSRGRRRAAASR
jgi:hypothetical protein